MKIKKRAPLHKVGRGERKERWRFLKQAGAKPPPVEFQGLRFFFLDLWIKFGKIIVESLRRFNLPTRIRF